MRSFPPGGPQAGRGDAVPDGSPLGVAGSGDGVAPMPPLVENMTLAGVSPSSRADDSGSPKCLLKAPLRAVLCRHVKTGRLDGISFTSIYRARFSCRPKGLDAF